MIEMFSNVKRVHLIGIGGIGMSGLARLFKARGFRVSGSDIEETEMTKALRREGMTIHIGHSAKLIHQNIDLVVHNRAISKNNPELRAARKKKIPALSYAEVLGDITRRYQTIAVSGSHGK